MREKKYASDISREKFAELEPLLCSVRRRTKPTTVDQYELTDSGNTGKPFAQGVRDALGEHVTVQVAKRSELHKFAVIPKRWVVERSFAWLEKNRRLWKNCERHINTSLQFVLLAFLALILRRS